MKILALDVSTHTGWAVLEQSEDGIQRRACGRLDLVRVQGQKYPWSYVNDVLNLADALTLLVGSYESLDRLVIEETNGGGRGSRYTQKLLEFLHLALLVRIRHDHPSLPVVYLNTGVWRSYAKVKLTKDDKRANAALSKARRIGADAEREMKKKIGVRGRTKIKNVAVRWANETYGLALKQGDHDIAEALALGTAFLLGAPEALPEDKQRKDKPVGEK